MRRATYLIAVAIFLVWATTLTLEPGSEPPERLRTHFGTMLAAIVCSFAALIWKKWRASGIFLLLSVGLIVGDCASFAYRLINVCGPGDRFIRSEADAIEVAKKKIVKNSHFSSQRFGSATDFVESLSDQENQENCCDAIRFRTAFLVIVWDVSLSQRTGNSRFVKVFLSNCGTIFTGESYIDPGW
jgi:hypothetical protein